jgi:hypothetical protein
VNFPGFYLPSNAWWFLLLIPLVVFYFLKLRRQRVMTSSLALWQQVINDSRVNSPFQRFKRNILLLLQILLLVLLVLAAMQPFWQGDTDRANRVPIMIDCSASMSAVDKDGKSRLDLAKEHVEEMIDGMLPDQQFCIISYSRTARRECGFTNNKRVLKDALADLKATDMPSNVQDGLQMAKAMSRSIAFDEVLLLSDGNFAPRVSLDLPFDLNFQRLPPAGANIGIVSLNAKAKDEGSWTVFVGIEGSSDADGSAQIEIRQGDELVDDQSIVISSGEVRRLSFELSTNEATALEVLIRPDGFDSLKSDNQAFIELPGNRSLFVYVPVELSAFRHALRGVKGINLYPSDSGATSDSYDLVLTDKAGEMALPTSVLFSVDVIPPNLTDLLEKGTSDEPGQVVDWRRSDPLLQHVELGDLLFMGQPSMTQGVGEHDFENLAYEVLVHGADGPLLVKKQDNDGLDFHLLFHTDRSTLPFRVGFPVIVNNLVQMTRDQVGLSQAHGGRTGVLPAMQLATESAVTVSGPNGYSMRTTSDPAGVVNGIAAPFAGTYQVSGGSGDYVIRASLLNGEETSLTGVDEIQFNELSVAAASAVIPGDRAFWPILAILALILTFVEWGYYNRCP